MPSVTTETVSAAVTSGETSSTVMETVTTTVVAMLSSSVEAMEATTKSMLEAGDSEAKKTADQLHYVMSAIIGPIVCFIGLAGNILSVITWCRPGMRSSTGRYLIGQAIADFGVLLSFLLCDSLQHWSPSVVNDKGYGVFFCYIGYPMFFFFVISSIWFTVGVTIDRYIMVCWITKAKRLCNERNANFGLGLIAVNCFLINIPHFASFTPVLDRPENKTGPAFVATEFQNGSGGKFYEFWIHCIILILIPWVSVLAMNIKIINKVSTSNRKMADKKTGLSVKKSKDSENQITRLLLTVTFTFLFFIGLQCIIQCFWMQQPSWADMNTVSAAFAFAKTGIVFNSSSNFILYCLTGRRFRNEVLKMFRLVKSDLGLSSLVDNTSSSGGTSGMSGTTSTTSTSGV